MNQNGASRDSRILEEFKRIGGGMSTSAFARHLMSMTDIFSFDERERWELHGAQAAVRESLRKRDGSGLPSAGQTTAKDETGAPVWTVRQEWLFADYELNVRDLAKQRDTLHDEAVKLADECEGRYGQRPFVGFPGEMDDFSSSVA